MRLREFNTFPFLRMILKLELTGNNTANFAIKCQFDIKNFLSIDTTLRI